MNEAPIFLTVYNRLEHLRQCVTYLQRCPESARSELYIASDAAYREDDLQAVASVREYIMTISGFSRIVPIFHEQNRGLKSSYYFGVDKIFEKHDRYIFLEDDVLVAPDFLTYMNEALVYYCHDPRVFSVSAFSFSAFYTVPEEKHNRTYFTNRFYPWGYGQWKSKALNGGEYSPEDVDRSLSEPAFLKRLQGIGQDLMPAFLSLRAQKKMLVLDYLHTYHMVRNDLLAVVPYQTKSFNIGHDGSGARTTKSKRFEDVNLRSLLIVRPYVLMSCSDELRDETFNQMHFVNTQNGLKMVLHRFGLLGLVMKLVNRYRGRE